jgi:hypothetical protein
MMRVISPVRLSVVLCPDILLPLFQWYRGEEVLLDEGRTGSSLVCLWKQHAVPLEAVSRMLTVVQHHRKISHMISFVVEALDKSKK